MPTTNVTGFAEYIVGNSGTSMEDSAALTNGNVVGGTANTWIPTYFKFSGAGLYYNYRAFGVYDLSSISGTVTGLKITAYRRTNASSPNIYVMAADCTDTVVANDYLNGIVGFDNTGDNPYEADGLSGGGSGAKLYTDSPFNPNDGGGDGDPVTINLNSTAVSDANSVIGSGKFKFVLVNTYDYNGTYGSASLLNAVAVQGVYFSSTQHSTSGLHPILSVTTTDAPSEAPHTFDVKGGFVNIKSGNLEI